MTQLELDFGEEFAPQGKTDGVVELAQTISHGWWLDDDKLRAFYKLVAAKEREAIAEMVKPWLLAEYIDKIRART